jgi:hypothetical protein
MSFWSDPTTEPKRSFKYKLTIQGLGASGGKIDSWVVKKVARPTFKVTEIAHSFLDKKYYFPGKVEWDALTCTVAEPLTPNALASLYSYLYGAGYNVITRPPSAASDYSTIGKSKAIISSVYVDQLNNDGSLVERWQLNNAFITSTTLTGMDYDTDTIMSFDMTIRFDWADFILA